MHMKEMPSRSFLVDKEKLGYNRDLRMFSVVRSLCTHASALDFECFSRVHAQWERFWLVCTVRSALLICECNTVLYALLMTSP